MRPTRATLAHLGAWLAVGLAVSFLPDLAPLWQLHGVALLGWLAVDAVAVRRGPPVEMERQLPASLPLGEWTRVRLRLYRGEARGRRALALTVFDHHPAHAEVEGMPRQLSLPADGWAEIEYRLRPQRRGSALFAPAELLLRSPTGLWQARRRVGEEQLVRVLPNFRAVTGFALLAHDDRLAEMGIRLHQRRGTGLEFRELRDYREGDSQRQIDWKATARRQRLISRQYQEEKDQQVVMLIDCGRRLRALDGELSHFDHVLNAALLLTYVAQRQGDAVGLMTFAGEERWLSPAKGGLATSGVLRTIYDLDTSTLPPDYLAAATRLLTFQRRRALVVLMTNLHDEDQSELLPALELLRRRNLVLVASLRETALGEPLAAPVDTFADALMVSAVHHYLEARAQAIQAVRARGILTLDVEPAELAIRAANRYLEIKRSGLL